MEIERLLESVEDQLTQIQLKVEAIDQQVDVQGKLTKKIKDKAMKNEYDLDEVNEKVSYLNNHLSDPSKVCCDFVLIVMTVMLVVMLVVEVTAI
jgi:peptidoglycan hydrolase CwlO-like protein